MKYLVLSILLLVTNLIFAQTTPVITEQPQDQTVSSGQTAIFTCNFSGPTNKGYQWSKVPWESAEVSLIKDIAGEIEGATTSQLKILNASLDDNGLQFLCETKDLDFYSANGSWLNSDVATLTVEEEIIFSGDVSLRTQQQVNEFGANSYSTINGYLYIGDPNYSDINDLSPLANITSVEGRLVIFDNYVLTNIEGLSNITSVGGDIYIAHNLVLTNLQGLRSINSVEGTLDFTSNPSLTNLDGLSNLTSAKGDLKIVNNIALANLDGLSNFTSIGENLEISGNESLTNSDGLSGITSVGGNIVVGNNPTLTNLNGLSNITSIGEDIDIRNNTSLADLEGLRGITEVEGQFTILGNPTLNSLDGLRSLTNVGGDLSIWENGKIKNLDGLCNVLFVGRGLQIHLNSSLTNLDSLSNITFVGDYLYIARNPVLTEFCGIFQFLNNGFTGTYDVFDNAVNPTKAEIIAAGHCKPITPTITKQPQNQTVLFGHTATFNILAESSGPLSYQWWRVPYTGPAIKLTDSIGHIVGSTTNVFKILNATFEDNNSQFLCEIKNINGYPEDGYWSNSNIVTLNVEPNSEEIFKIISPYPTLYFEVEDWYNNQTIQYDYEYEVGATEKIEWISNLDGSLKIEYSTDMGKHWKLIADDIDASQQYYDWLIPNTPSAFCKIRISSNSITSQVASSPTSYFDSYDLSFAIVGKNKWMQLPILNSSNLKQIKFENPLKGFIYGNGALIITNDGGKTWDVKGNFDYMNLSNVEFISQDIGWGRENFKYLIKTNDGGKTWSKIYDLPYTEGYDDFSLLQMWDDTLGWYGYQDYIARTLDGGLTWNSLTHVNSYTNNFEFISEQTGWIEENRFEGISWRLTQNSFIDYYKNKPIYGGYSSKLEYLDSTHIWNVRDLYESNDRPIMSRTIEFSTDGKNFIEQYTVGISNEDLYSFNSNILWLNGETFNLASENNDPFSFICFSTDGGNYWQLQTTNYPKNINSIYSYDGETCWAVGDSGLIMQYGSFTETPDYWSRNIQISDNFNNSDIVFFGQVNNATEDIDEALGESELPPLPPTGTFDARFILENNSSTNLDLRNSAESEITWTIQFQPNTSGYPITFSWDKDNLPFGSFYLKDAITGKIINVDMKLNDSLIVSNESINKLQIVYKEQLTSTINTNKDWNLVSISLKADHMETTELFPEATSSAFKYSTGYNSQSTLENGIGYWIKFNESSSTNIYGEEVNSPIQVNEGWNIIGSYNNELDVSQIETTPVNILSGDIYGFDNGYYIADKLEVGKGYWVKAAQDGEISFNTTNSLNKSVNKFDEEPTINFDIIASNGIGDSISLSFGLDSLATNGYDEFLGEKELPPLPPLGAFDVRIEIPDTLITTYTDIRELAANCYDHTISYQLADSSQDLSLSWDLPEGVTLTISDLFGGAIFNESFESGKGEFVIKNPNINNAKLTLCYSNIILSNKDYEFVPTEYTLSQNYPNPFNPSTKIQFGLPKASEVSVSIYNILGERVKDLVSQDLKAGFHETEFNNTSLSSGIYFYRIEAGEYVETRKMILLK